MYMVVESRRENTHKKRIKLVRGFHLIKNNSLYKTLTQEKRKWKRKEIQREKEIMEKKYQF